MATDPESESSPMAFAMGPGGPSTPPTGQVGYCEYELDEGGNYVLKSNQCVSGCFEPPTPAYSPGDPTTVRVNCVAGG